MKNTVKKRFLTFVLIITGLGSMAQVGGDATYTFLELPNSARVAALGGSNISLYDNDLNMVYYNPALLNEGMHNHLALNYSNYIADINYGYASYAYNLEGIGTLGAGIYYINYGEFIRADETGVINGNFYADEYSVNLYYSRHFLEDSSLSVGGSLKTIYSALEQYTSVGLAVDAGVNYHKPGSDFSASLLVNNLGMQLSTYTQDNREPLPFDIQAGVSWKTKHAPFRVSLGLHQLTHWKMRYESPLITQQLELDDTDEEISFSNRMGRIGDELMRHIVLGVEITPSDNFFLAFGYNYQRRTELALSNRPGLIGFSAGAGIKISKFMLSYGMGRYHMAGTTHTISITTDLGEFITKDQTAGS
ncbi:MAG TPA: type IX secretion system protein PorQ [Bacteroidales bacterium]|nr:type IX secretion system protein PorQ [Bacteroidales bacterium]